MHPYWGRGLAALMLAMASSAAFLAPFAAAADPHDGSWHSGKDPHEERCARADDPHPDRPKFCAGVGAATTTTTVPKVSGPPTTTPVPTTPTTAVTPSPPAPLSNPDTSGPDTSDADSFTAQVGDESLPPPDITVDTGEDAPVAIGPGTPVPDSPFGWPPVGGGLDDESGIPTGVFIVIGIAGGAAALLIARGGFGAGKPFLSVPNDYETLGFG